MLSLAAISITHGGVTVQAFTRQGGHDSEEE
jgi:hypothetical protein